MVKLEIPILDETTTTIATDEVMEVVADAGILRKTELEEQVELSGRELTTALVQLVERGDVALFPIGDHVQIRDES